MRIDPQYGKETGAGTLLKEKERMKRVIGFLLAGVISLGLVACGGQGSEQQAENSAEQTQAETNAGGTDETAAKAGGKSSLFDVADGDPDNPDKLGEVKPGKDYKLGLCLGWRDEFGSGLEAAIIAAAEAYGCEITSVDANNNANNQISQVQTFVSQGCDGIIVKMVDTENAEQILNVAGDVPITFVNIVPKIDLAGTNSTKVGSNEREAGTFQAEFLIDYFKKKGVDKVRYVMLQGTLGLGHTTDRTNAANETLAAAEGIDFELVYEDTAEYDRSKAQNKMQTYLGTNPEFDAVICNNDEMAIGATVAMKSAGMDLSDLPVCGIDATPAGLKAMADGDIAMSVYQDANGQGLTAVRAAIVQANGNSIEPLIYVPYQPVTPDNMADYTK